jgi:autotransporter-associated beta strand protein
VRFRSHGLNCAGLVLGAVVFSLWLAPEEPSVRVSLSSPEVEESRHEPLLPRADLRWVAQQADEEKDAPSLKLGADFPDRIVSADGKSVTISLPDGAAVKGEVEALRRDEKGVQSVEGRVTHPEPGRFMFQRQTVPGKAGPLVGFIHFEKSTVAWQVRPSGPKREPVLVKTTVDRVMCRALPPRGPEAIPQTHPDDYPVPADENGVVQLQSLPGAAAVVYLDFDGEERVFPLWGYINALPSGASNAQIHEVWRGVAEDFLPFNINVTTIRSVYQNAAEGSRMQVIVTPTKDASPTSGGVAYTGSFNWSGNMVCWSFSTTGKNAVEVISHEVGHTLGLGHDGLSNPFATYYLGHSGWAPIMGLGYYQTPSQWSKGEYQDANNTEDDIQIIATANNGVDFRADDHGDAAAAATWLDVTSAGAVSNEGVIGSAPDADLFRFDTTGGNLTLAINNATFNPNLDIEAEILNSAQTVIATSNSTGSLDASFASLSLAAGTHYLRVKGTGLGDPNTTGYSDYGSLGAYTITGTINGGVHEERLAVDEHSSNSTVAGTIVPRADHGAGTPAFAILSGNTGGTFIIDPVTGEISVANNTLLDFETLSPRWDVPARFELFVEITDHLTIATETLRVVISVTDVNEAPLFPPPDSVLVPERLAIGTAVASIAATDPDRGDSINWSIVSGNTGGAFAMDPSTGVLTCAAPLDFETLAAYTLTLRATDNGTPELWTEETITISLLDIAEDLEPGGVARTVFRGIVGSAVSDLASHPNFPNRPHAEETISSFATNATDGKDYGAAFRALVIAPVTGTYTFSVAGDDSAELLLGTDATPAGAATIAYLTTRTDPEVWDAQPTQQSAGVFLTAGEARYIEARHKQSDEAAHLQVAWQPPGASQPSVIQGRWLVPWQEDYAPWAAETTAIARIFTANGQSVEQTDFIEPDNGQQVVSHAITAGNEAGLFAIDSSTGLVTVANAAGLVEGASHSLTIEATDDDSPAATGSTTLDIEVIGLDDQLHAWWPLDETAGPIAYDVTGNFRHGELLGGTAWVPRSPANGALELNGSSDLIENNAAAGFSGTASFTVAAWVKLPPSHHSDGVLAQQQQGGTDGDAGSYLITIRADGSVRFIVRGREEGGETIGNQFDISSAATIDDGSWHHVACVRDGESGRIFIDGALSGSGSGAIRVMNPDLTVAVGADARHDSDFLEAIVDDIRFYQDALGATQIQKAAGAPKVAITHPVAGTVDIPSGVGLLLQTATSDPDGSTPSLSWSHVSGPGSVSFNPAGPGETAVTFTDNGSHLLRVTADDGDQTATAQIAVNVGLTASSPFALTAYGDASFGGQLQTGARSYVVYGAADGIHPSGTSDSFHLLGQSFTGDFDVRARIGGFDDVPDTSAERAGLALRVGTGGNPDEVGGFIGFTEGGNGIWIRRPTVGGANLEVGYTPTSPTSWCRIERSGGIIRYYHSGDGETWIERGLVINFSELQVGLCWASGNTTEVGTAVFEEVTGFSPDNLGPYVEASAGATAYVNFPADLNGLADDDGRPAPASLDLEWRLASGPAPPGFADATQAVTTVNCTAPGPHTFRLVADDGAVRTFAEVSLDAETIDLIGVTATDANAAETGPDTATFTFTREGSMSGDLTVPITVSGTATPGDDYAAFPESIVIPDGEETVTLTLTPIADNLPEGPETVIVSIGFGDFTITDDTAQATIADSNNAPEWASFLLNRPDGEEGVSYSAPGLGPEASDPEEDDLVFSKVAGPAWLEVAADGTLSGTPGASDTGPNSFTVRATDTGGLHADAVLAIQIDFTNDPPVFTADPVIAASAMAGLPYISTLPGGSANDPDLAQGDTLVFSKSAGAAWLEVNPNGSLGGTPPAGVFGDQDFTIRVTDVAGSFAETTLRITVVPATLYFDANGTDPASGAPPTVTWDGAPLWSSSPAGDLITVPWIDESHAVFSAGVDAASTTVTVDGTRAIASLAVEEGALVLTGGSILLGGPATPFAITGETTIATPLDVGGVVKSGPGALILEGSQPFTGPFVVQAGTVTLRGSLAGTSGVTVAAAATLDGGGSVIGPLTLAGTLAPGEGVGSIQPAALSLETDAAIVWQCGDWEGGAGIGFDTIQTTTLNLSAATSFEVRLASSSLANFTETAQSFPLIQTTGGITGFIAENVTIDASAFPEAAGTWSLRADGNDLMLDYAPPPPFVLWQIAEFGEDVENPSIAGPAADPDHDGSENLLEYALGMDPNTPDSPPVIMDFVDVSGTDHLRLTISRNPSATDVTFLVQTSGDLELWSADDTVIETDTPSLLVVRDSLAGPKRFIRLAVTR